MADPRGFLKYRRDGASRRPVQLRLKDWQEVYVPPSSEKLHEQAARCMDCGIPFCHHGCPLGNLIPEWSDLTFQDDMREAIDRLHATNNFPEFTGRLCPAPCEAACTLGINDDPVSIEFVEKSIIEHAYTQGWVLPLDILRKTGKSIAIVGSGPAGLAAAQQLTRAGHEVVVYERGEEIGGLLRYGIPEFKMEKAVLDRRLDQMRQEGTQFLTGVSVGSDRSLAELQSAYDAVVLATGSTIPRELSIPGRELVGIHQAMEFLPPANSVALGKTRDHPFSASGKKVVIIGGGDTGADCLGTVHRQGAAHVVQLEIMSKPPNTRAQSTPWPTWPLVYRVSSAHEEGGDRAFSINTERFLGNGQGAVTALEVHEVEVKVNDGRMSFEAIPGTQQTIEADLVLLALGFTGPETASLDPNADLALDSRGNFATDSSWMTSMDGIFAAGDCRRGQSLIVWAIAEGRSVASAVDRHLMGMTDLPSPIDTATRALAL